jgi:hypothetical protein
LPDGLALISNTKSNSCFTPQKGKNKELDSIITLIKNETDGHILKSGKNKLFFNIDTKQKCVLKELRNYSNIVFTVADKNGPITIFNKNDYLNLMTMEHLSNPNDVICLNSFDIEAGSE